MIKIIKCKNVSGLTDNLPMPSTTPNDRIYRIELDQEYIKRDLDQDSPLTKVQYKSDEDPSNNVELHQSPGVNDRRYSQ